VENCPDGMVSKEIAQLYQQRNGSAFAHEAAQYERLRLSIKDRQSFLQVICRTILCQFAAFIRRHWFRQTFGTESPLFYKLAFPEVP
jgi:hypothetical protein